MSLTSDVKAQDRKTPEYKEGQKAFADRAKDEDCPYIKGDVKRMYWFLGYGDARVNNNVGGALKQSGLTFP
jgi:ribosome modulation factor